MSMSDPIADMLTRIRNAKNAQLKYTDIRYSRIKEEIARVLKEQGFIKDYIVSAHQKKLIRIILKYTHGRKPLIQDLKRISKPSVRHYVSAKEIPTILGGMGISILSTCVGILTGDEAKARKVGGELLCLVW